MKFHDTLRHNTAHWTEIEISSKTFPKLAASNWDLTLSIRQDGTSAYVPLGCSDGVLTTTVPPKEPYSLSSQPIVTNSTWAEYRSWLCSISKKNRTDYRPNYCLTTNGWIILRDTLPCSELVHFHQLLRTCISPGDTRQPKLSMCVFAFVLTSSHRTNTVWGTVIVYVFK